MNVLIPAAGQGRRMKSFGPKALVKVGHETILQRQIRVIRSIYPKSKIVVVVGFEADKVRRTLPPKVYAELNNEFENTNVAHSIALGLRRFSQRECVLVCYGDLVFNEKAIEGIDRSVSCAILDHVPGLRTHEVGATVVDGKVTTFSYGLPLKWSHLVLLAPPERRLFQQIASEPFRRKQYGFEILNEVIDRGGVIHARTPEGLKLVEVDTSKDIEHASALIS